MIVSNIKDLDINELAAWGVAEAGDTVDLLEQIDQLLSIHELRLIVGDRGDDNDWILIEKVKKT